MRITAGDVLGWLAAGASHNKIFEDFPELTQEDIPAVLTFAADRKATDFLFPMPYEFLPDQNISYSVVKLLSGHFATVTQVRHEILTDASGPDIRNHTIKNGYTVVACDDAFIKYNHLYGAPTN